MYKIRISGRGGQGSKSAAEILGKAAFMEKLYAQSFALYGAERKGAPVDSFVRIDTKPILERNYVNDPDCIIAMDPTLLKNEKTLSGLKKDGLLIINSSKNLNLKLPKQTQIAYVDATGIALKIIKKNVYNTSMLAAFAKLNPQISVKKIEQAVANYLGKKHKEMIKTNIKAMEQAAKEVKVVEWEKKN